MYHCFYNVHMFDCIHLRTYQPDTLNVKEELIIQNEYNHSVGGIDWFIDLPNQNQTISTKIRTVLASTHELLSYNIIILLFDDGHWKNQQFVKLMRCNLNIVLIVLFFRSVSLRFWHEFPCHPGLQFLQFPVAASQFPWQFWLHSSPQSFPYRPSGQTICTRHSLYVLFEI